MMSLAVATAAIYAIDDLNAEAALSCIVWRCFDERGAVSFLAVGKEIFVTEPRSPDQNGQ